MNEANVYLLHYICHRTYSVTLRAVKLVCATVRLVGRKLQWRTDDEDFDIRSD